MAKKKKNVKNVNVKPITNHDNIQIDIKKDLEEETKIKPEKIFDGYNKKPKKKVKGKVPKGSHRMPDGSIMKNSDMTKSKGKKKSTY